MATQRDYSALRWVIDEIDQIVKQTNRELTRFAENPADATDLHSVLTHAHKLHATLRVLDCPTATGLAAEIEAVAQGLMHGEIGITEAALQALFTASSQIPGYLQKVVNAGTEFPAALRPLENDLRALRGMTPLPAGNDTGAGQDSADSDQSIILDDLGGTALVVKEVSEQLQSIQQDLERYANGDSSVLSRLKESDKTILNMASTLSLLGFDNEETILANQLQQLAGLSGDTQADSGLLTEVLTSLMRVGQSMTSRLTALGVATDNAIDHLATAREAVFAEFRTGLAQVKQQLRDFISAGYDLEILHEMSPALSRLAATSGLVELPRVRGLLVRCMDYVDGLHSARHPVSENHLERLAEAVSGIEYYIEQNRQKAEASSTVLDRVAASLAELPGGEVKPQVAADVAVSSELSLDEAALSGSEPEHEGTFGLVKPPAEIAADPRLDSTTEEVRTDVELELDRLLDLELTTDDSEAGTDASQVEAELDSEDELELDGHFELELAPEGLSERTGESPAEGEREPEPGGDFELELSPEEIDFEPELAEEESDEFAELRDDTPPDEELTALAESELPGAFEDELPEIDLDSVKSLLPDEAEFSQPLPRAPELTESRETQTDHANDQSLEPADQETLANFVGQLELVFDTIDTELPAWRQDHTSGLALPRLRRAFRTLKGLGSSVGAQSIRELAGLVEDLLGCIADGSLDAVPETLEVVAQTRSLLPELVAGFSGQGNVNPDSLPELQLRIVNLMRKEPAVPSYFPETPAETGAEPATVRPWETQTDEVLASMAEFASVPADDAAEEAEIAAAGEPPVELTSEPTAKRAPEPEPKPEPIEAEELDEQRASGRTRFLLRAVAALLVIGIVSAAAWYLLLPEKLMMSPEPQVAGTPLEKVSGPFTARPAEDVVGGGHESAASVPAQQMIPDYSSQSKQPATATMDEDDQVTIPADQITQTLDQLNPPDDAAESYPIDDYSPSPFEARTVPVEERIAESTTADDVIAAGGTLEDDETYLLQLNGSNWTMQLLASQIEAGIVRFRRQLAIETRCYRKLRDGKDLFVVVHGDFATRHEATAAVAELPQSLRQMQPWVRSIAGVQREIRAANSTR